MMAQIARAYSGLLDNVYWDILLLLHCTKIKYIGQTGKQEEFTQQIRTMDCGVQFTMEEGKLFLSVTELYCHDYLILLSRRSFSVQVK